MSDVQALQALVLAQQAHISALEQERDALFDTHLRYDRANQVLYVHDQGVDRFALRLKKSPDNPPQLVWESLGGASIEFPMRNVALWTNRCRRTMCLKFSAQLMAYPNIRQKMNWQAIVLIDKPAKRHRVYQVQALKVGGVWKDPREMYNATPLGAITDIDTLTQAAEEMGIDVDFFDTCCKGDHD